MRVSFGSLITDTSDESEQSESNEVSTDKTEAFHRLLAGGGNLYLNFELPVYLYQNDIFTFYGNTSAKLGMEVSEFSNEIDKSTGNGHLRGNIYTSLSTDNREFTFFAQINYGLYFRYKDFYRRLEIVDEKAFGFGEITAGFTINNSLLLALTLNTLSSEENLRSGQVLIGTQILSGLFEK